MTSAQELVLEAVAARGEADERLADALWAAKQRGASSNNIARWVKGTWSRPTVLSLLPVAQWRAGVRQVLTEAGLTVGSRDRPDGAEADVRISVPNIGRPGVVADLGWAMPPHPGGARLGDDEPFAEFVKRAGDVTRTLWLEATRRRAEIAVPALLSAGYRLFEPPSPPVAGAPLTFKTYDNDELTEAEAIEYLTKDVLVAVVIEPAKGT